jgi:hypothetical protein
LLGGILSRNELEVSEWDRQLLIGISPCEEIPSIAVATCGYHCFSSKERVEE